MRTLRLGMAQMNSTVGDLGGNAEKILSLIEKAQALEVDLLAFPELAITGYPPEDLLLKAQFVSGNMERLLEIIPYVQGLTAVIGFVDAQEDIYNAAAVVSDGKLAGVYHKVHLPNYGVFDENRYFQRGSEASVFAVGGVTVGVNICEDIWYPAGPVTAECMADAELLVNINASPYHAGKRVSRHRMLSTRASDNAVILSYTNMVGGQDELVFDGNSVVFDQKGELVAEASQFEEDLLVVDLDIESVFRARLHDPRRRQQKVKAVAEHAVATRIVASTAALHSHERPIERLQPTIYDPVGEVYAALVLGTRDYVRKNSFRKVIVGLSGGIDSSLTATIAVDALGEENVLGVSMPSRYSSQGSMDDAHLLARNLGVELVTIPIEPPFEAMLSALAEAFRGTDPGVAEENLQARIRGNILMAFSNKFGYLVLTTGNKSEMGTGYSTLYGDMAGGFAIIKDVPKTMVYQLARHRNQLAGSDLIPQSVLGKEPSAELRPGQRDVDSLPPYSTLDPILQAYVEEDRSYEEMLAMGFDENTLQRVITLVDLSEYKRRQAPPGVKITERAFGRDRRLPITNRYRSY